MEGSQSLYWEASTVKVAPALGISEGLDGADTPLMQPENGLWLATVVTV
jgi:hypothetical protein